MAEGPCSPSRQLEIAVVRLQQDIDDYRAELEITRPPKRSGFTSTPVPRFQESRTGSSFVRCLKPLYVRMVTAALQLLSHLDGDALNVALLVPEFRRVVPGFLVKSLSDHYSSPGRLAEYKRQFQRAFRRPGDDPSIFAIELETLARRAPQTLGQFGT